MSTWKKSPPELIAYFDGLIESFPEAERRLMFGFPCIFVHGNMTAGLFQDRMMMRLSEKDRQAFLNLPGARLFEPMKGKPMKEYVEVPDAMLASATRVRPWLAKSVAYAESLPVKVGKKKAGGRL
jgi:TfoX/Sxy family transcriptional regulator of competence genes